MKSKFILIIAALATLFGNMGALAQNLIDGYTRIFYADDLQDGKAYFLISDRTLYSGNKTGKPKGMSNKLDKYTISWDKPSSGIYFVYWGDFDPDEVGFQWIAEDMGDGKWAFKNVVKEEYLGVKNSYDDDVLFSASPVGYTLTDLDDGEGRFFMTSSENTHSPHVQGYLRSDRPNNSLAKQSVGDDDYRDDVADYGYPGRWQIYEVESTPTEKWITDPSEIKAGDEYYIICQRTKFTGNTTGKQKAMSTLQSSYTVNWGEQYVYWGDLNKEEDGYIWTAVETDVDGQWAFVNKENGMYLGKQNTSPVEPDIVFSETPEAYTVSGAEGIFRFTHVATDKLVNAQGYGINRFDNSLKLADDDIPSDVADNGSPSRWKMLRIGGGSEPTPTYTIKPGYYNVVLATSGSEKKRAWMQKQIDESSISAGADLTCAGLTSDPRMVFKIDPIEGEDGKYSIKNYVSNKYVGEAEDGLMLMSDTLVAQEVELVEGTRNTLFIYNETTGENRMYAATSGHVAADDNWNTPDSTAAMWKLQSVSQADLDAIPQEKMELTDMLASNNNPNFADYSELSDEQKEILKKIWYKADSDVQNGTYDIIYRQDIANLDAALKGTYQEPIYNKYQQDTLRVLSYNVQHCAKGLQKVADAILAQRADVVALQELDSAWSRSNYKYQVKELSDLTGMYGIFCSALEGYGIGILSKQIPLSIKVVALTSDFEPRRMLVAEYDNYVFASLHVGLSANARRGTGPIIKAEAENWVELGKPLIIAGDFNDDGTDGEMEGARGVLTKYLQENGFTYHSDLTTPTWSAGTYIIDNIISYDPIGGVEKISYEVVNDKTTSDHMPIVADLLVGFEDPDAVGSITDVNPPTVNGKVYSINGTVVSNSADGVTQLPGGIYIYDGKKMKK